MRILSIEPTPNPNAMKLTVEPAQPEGVAYNYTTEEQARAPAPLRAVLAVPGVRSVYQVADFVAVERHPRHDWREVLEGVQRALTAGGAEAGPAAPVQPPDQVKVQVQFFRGLPMQVKLTAGAAASRAPLPPRFAEAAMRAAEASPNAVLERLWVDYGVRYGDPAAVGAEVAAEIDAAYDDERLAQLEAAALAQGPGEVAPAAAEPLPPEAVAQALAEPDWRRRYAALDRLEPDEAALPVIVQALGDANPSVRRLAAVYLGEVGTPAVLAHLFTALKDPSAAVRRAAGDCLSDMGDPAAIGPMCEALKDPSKLVRWRAARYLYEVGDSSALPALEAAADDPEFEVQLQVRLAIQRITA